MPLTRVPKKFPVVKIAVFMFALFPIATIAAAYAIALFNALVDAKHQVEQAWSGIDVLLRQRHDEVPGLVDMLGAHGGPDSGLLERVSGLFFKGLAGMARCPLFAAAEHDRTDMEVGTLPVQ